MRPSLLATVAIATLCLLGVSIAADAGTPRTHGTPSVLRATAPTPPPASPARASSGPASAWLNVGPNRLPGRFHCTTQDALNPAQVACGADGSGYWWGDGTGASSWTERGKELGGGIQQMTACPFFPVSQSAYQRLSVIREQDLSMFNTIDDGATWHPDTLDPLPGYTLGPALKLGADGHVRSLAYALVYAEDSGHQPGIAFLKSTDGGEVYGMTRFVATSTADLWCARTDASVLLLAYGDSGGNLALERSLDQGVTWQSLGGIPFADPSGDSLAVIAQEAADPDSMHVWVLEQSELFASQDGGQDFTDTNTQIFPRAKRPLQASLVHADLLVWSSDDQGEQWSPDGGVTVNNLSAGWPSGDGTHPVGGDIDCWLLPASVTAHRATLASGSEEFYLATAGGVYGWSLEDPIPHVVTNDLAVTLQVSDLYTRRSGTEKYNLVCATRDEGVVGMTTSDNSNLPENSSWNQLMWMTSSYEVAHIVTSFKPTPADPVAFADFAHGSVATNGDNTGSGTGISIGELRHESLFADPVGPYRFYAVSFGLYRETWNRGANTWLEETLPSPIGAVNGYGIGFAIASANTSRWYLETDLGNVYFSTNAGATWTVGSVTGTPPGIIDSDYHYTKIAVNPTNALEAWIVGTSVIHTTDGGAHWSTLTTGLPAGAIHAWALAYDVPTARAYLATDSGPFQWSGSAWTDLAPAGGVVPAVAFRAVESLPWAGVVRWGTWGRGVWDFATGATTAVAGTSPLTLELAMRQNPVRDFARLDYALPQAGRVKLEVLDVAGRRVTTLVDGEQPAGPGSATLDGRALGAGVYFARLLSDQGQRTTRMVILR